MFVELLKAWRMCFLCRDMALDVGNRINLTFTFLPIMRLFNQQGKSILEKFVCGKKSELSNSAQTISLYAI